MSYAVSARRDVRQLLNAINGMYGLGPEKDKYRGENGKPRFLGMGYKAPNTLYRAKLRAEFILSNSTNNYKWNFLDAVTPVNIISPQISTEVQLVRNDAFHAIAMRVMLGRRVQAAPGTMVGATYPNVGEFPAAVGFNPDHLELVYNGQYLLKVNTKQYIDGASMDIFRCVNQSQQSAAVPTPNLNQSAFDQLAWTDGTEVLEPLVSLFGNKTNELQLEFPSFPAGAPYEWQSVTPGVDHVVIVEYHGWRAEGVAGN